MSLFVSSVVTPIGVLLCAASAEGVLHVADWDDCPERFARLLRRHAGTEPASLTQQAGGYPALAAYFAGNIDALDGIPVHLGGPPFQVSVWHALRRVKAGETISYTGLADRVGRPRAARAAGAANGANPISVVVPCHRAVGAHGALTGYAGGLERKRWLLAHENRP